MTTGMDQLHDSLFLDSRSSYPMCASRDLFNAYKPHASGSILMGDNVKLMSIGIEMVKN